MIDLTGTTAELAKFQNYHQVVFLIILRADSPSLGEDPQYIATDQFTLDGQAYQDWLTGLTFSDSARLQIQGGMASVGNIQFKIGNATKRAAALMSDYTLQNDVVEAYLVFVDGTETAADRIPLGRGVITRSPYNAGEWTLDVIDGSDQEEVPVPSRLILPAEGNSFEFAPLDSWDRPLPFPFGTQQLSPYDGQGTKAFLSPCRCTDWRTQQFTAGLSCKTYGTPYQWYPQADRWAEILDYTQTGAYFTIDSGDRRLLILPTLEETLNTEADWYLVADGDATTSVQIGPSVLHVRFGGCPKLGNLTGDPTLEIVATGSYTYEVKLSGSIIASGSTSGNASIALDDANWADKWDFESLTLKLTTGSSATFASTYLLITFSDQSPLDVKVGSQVSQKIQGLYDNTAFYRDGGLVTGVADTLIENPVDIIQAGLRHIDVYNQPVANLYLPSFTTARAKRTSWKYAFTLWESIPDKRAWLDGICKEAGLHLVKNRAGQWRIIARDKADAPQHTFLTEWNILVDNPSAPATEHKPLVAFNQVENRDLTNNLILHAQRDLMGGNHYNARALASSAYAITGTGSTDPSTAQFTWPGGKLQTMGAETGWVVYLDSDQAYRFTASPIDEETVVIEPVVGGTINTNTSVQFWAGPSLDVDALRSRRRHKTMNTLGRAAGGIRDIGGYESPFIADEATLDLMIAHWKEWGFSPPKVVELTVPVGHIDVEEGDTAIFDDPWLEEAKRPISITALDGALDNNDLVFKVTDGEVGLIAEDDYLLIRDDALHPEVIGPVAAIDMDTDQVTVAARGIANTQAVAHDDGATIERVIYFWGVLSLQAPSPSDMRMQLALMEKPLDWSLKLRVAPEDLPVWSAMTPAQRLRYGAVAYNSGFINDRDPATRLTLVEG